MGQRFDVALVEALAAKGVEVTRSRLAKSFAAGKVRVGGKPVKPGWIVEASVAVEVELVESPLLSAEPEDLPLSVVHEDEAVLVVDKPAGMVVHPSVGHEHGTLVSAVLHHLGVDAPALPVLPGNDETRPGIVHRIDKDTSGLIVLAKTAAAQGFLAKQFEAHSIERRYVGVVRGEPSFKTRTAETAHTRDPADRRRFAPGPSGRRAVTHFEVVEILSSAAVVHCTLETGRTHQIRMHARWLGHPIVGDALYGRPHPGLDRHALHAELLGFDHPAGGHVRFTAPLPPELVSLIESLRA